MGKTFVRLLQHSFSPARRRCATDGVTWFFALKGSTEPNKKPITPELCQSKKNLFLSSKSSNDRVPSEDNDGFKYFEKHEDECTKIVNYIFFCWTNKNCQS